MIRVLRPSRLAGAALLASALALAFARQARAADVPVGPVCVVSTVDVRGKIDPCGCKVPAGGLARLASFADSMRAAYGPVVLVDGGGFFPITDGDQATAAFLLSNYRLLAHDAVGITEKELRYGRGFLLAQLARTGVPAVCANLVDRASGKPLVAPWVLREASGVQVGIFAVTSDQARLGALADSVTVTDPVAAARTAVAELKAHGATVIVALAQLGPSGSEDLATAVDGIDLVICGRGVPLRRFGRTVGHTLMCYGGDQGQYAGRSVLALDAGRHVTKGDSEMIELAPAVGDNQAVLRLVRAFKEREVTKAAAGK